MHLAQSASELLQREVLGAPVGRWVAALSAAVAGYIFLVLMRRLLIRRLGALSERTATLFDDIVVDLIRRTRRFFIAAMSLALGARVVDLTGGPAEVLKIVVVLSVTVQAVMWVGVAVTRLVEVRLREADPSATTTLSAVSFLIRMVLYVILLLLGLSNLGINVSALLTGLGIGGVAVALALQNVLGDLFASLSIVLDKPFVVGDFVVVGDMMGSVEYIGLKTTRVRSLSGEQIVLGNGDLLKSRIRNYKRMAQRRVVFTLGVVYQTSPATLATIPDILKGLVTAEAGVRFDRAHFKSFDDFALTFEVVYFVLDADYNRYMDIQQRILLGIATRFEKEGIEFAYPTRTVFVKAESPAAVPPAGAD